MIRGAHAATADGAQAQTGESLEKEIGVPPEGEGVVLERMPDFWIRALTNHSSSAEWVCERDEEAL